MALLVCAVAIAQSAALTSEHEQHRATDHGCLVCIAGSLPFLEPGTRSPVAPVLFVEWMESAPDFEAANAPRSAARSCRAPPV